MKASRLDMEAFDSDGKESHLLHRPSNLGNSVMPVSICALSYAGNCALNPFQQLVLTMI